MLASTIDFQLQRPFFFKTIERALFTQTFAWRLAVRPQDDARFSIIICFFLRFWMKHLITPMFWKQGLFFTLFLSGEKIKIFLQLFALTNVQTTFYL